jgi:hypothetical protein
VLLVDPPVLRYLVLLEHLLHLYHHLALHHLSHLVLLDDL